MESLRCEFRVEGAKAQGLESVWKEPHDVPVRGPVYELLSSGFIAEGCRHGECLFDHEERAPELIEVWEVVERGLERGVIESDEAALEEFEPPFVSGSVCGNTEQDLGEAVFKVTNEGHFIEVGGVAPCR